MRRWLTGSSIAVLSLLALPLGGCATLQQIVALKNVVFHIGGIDGVNLAGIDLAGRTSLSDFGVTDAARLTVAFADGKLPLAMTVGVDAENPSDNSVSARLLKMGWMLRLQGKDTVSGQVDQQTTLAPGVPARIPVQVQVELLQFFSDNLGDLVRLAGGISGVTQDRTEVELMLQPTIDTPLGPMSFPEPVRALRTQVGG